MSGQAIRLPSGRTSALSSSLWPVLALATALIALTIGWVGYTASDDAAYYFAALEWLQHPPFPGHDHWATRFPLVISLAAMIGLIGKGALAMNVTALLWYVIFLVVVRTLATRIGGTRAGWLATMLIGTMPVVVTNATTVSCDLTEATFLILGVMLIGDAAIERGRWRLPIGAGLCLGAAILCRETTSLALLGFVPLFIIGRPAPRDALVTMGLACAILLGAEALFQFVLTGDPLNRWALAFNHDSGMSRAANLEGNFLVHPVIDPLLVLLINDDFALLFWLAAAAVAMQFHRGLDRAGRVRMTILTALALATFVLVGALYTKLVLNPRYFMLPAIAGSIAVAVWLDRMKPLPRAALLVVAIGTNLLMLSVENAHPRWRAEALVQAAREHRGTAIVTDAEVLHRAELPIEWNGLTGMSAGAPTPGVLYLSAEVDAPAGAALVSRYPSPPTPLGRGVQALGLSRFVPGSVGRRLFAPNPAMVLTRPAPRAAP